MRNCRCNYLHAWLALRDHDQLKVMHGGCCCAVTPSHIAQTLASDATRRNARDWFLVSVLQQYMSNCPHIRVPKWDPATNERVGPSPHESVKSTRSAKQLGYLMFFNVKRSSGSDNVYITEGEFRMACSRVQADHQGTGKPYAYTWHLHGHVAPDTYTWHLAHTRGACSTATATNSPRFRSSWKARSERTPSGRCWWTPSVATWLW